MNNKFIFLLFFLLFSQLELFSQNKNENEEVFVVSKVISPSFVINFEYSDNGFVTSETKVADNDYLSYKYEYEYDEQGNIIVLTKTDINFVSREENEYSGNNQITIKKIYQDYGAGFKFVEQHLYTYQDEQLKSIIQQMVSGNEQDFNNNIKQVFFYNNRNLLEKIHQYAWVVDAWMDMDIFDFEYDEYDKILNYTFGYFSADIFYKFWRYMFHYDGNNELSERTYHYYLNEGWNPVPDKKVVYHFEPVPESDTYLFPNIYQFDELGFKWPQPSKKLIQSDYWETNCGNPLHFVESNNYFYEILILGSDTVPDDTIPEDTLKMVNYYNYDDIFVFPNPTTGVLNLVQNTIQELKSSKVQSVVFFDIYGRKQNGEWRMENREWSINISNFPAGIYFLKIETRKGTITKKVIKL